MDIVECITPSGHKVSLRPYLTYTDKRELRKIYANYMSVDVQAQKTSTIINGRAMFEAEEYALRAVIVRLVEASGKTYEGSNAYDALMAWENEADGDAVIAKVNELTKQHELSDADKKK